MADHIKLQILKRITDDLENIGINNGYEHDLRGKVFRGRGVFSSTSDAPPMISIIEAPAPASNSFADPEGSVVKEGEWTLLIQGWAKDPSKGIIEATHPTDAVYALLADVQRRMSDYCATAANGKPLFPGKYRIYNLATSVKLGAPVVRPADGDVSSLAFFYLPMRIDIAYSLTEPWHVANKLG